jgi:hypothetical protein
LLFSDHLQPWSGNARRGRSVQKQPSVPKMSALTQNATVSTRGSQHKHESSVPAACDAPASVSTSMYVGARRGACWWRLGGGGIGGEPWSGNGHTPSRIRHHRSSGYGSGNSRAPLHPTASPNQRRQSRKHSASKS